MITKKVFILFFFLNCGMTYYVDTDKILNSELLYAGLINANQGGIYTVSSDSAINDASHEKINKINLYNISETKSNKILKDSLSKFSDCFFGSGHLYNFSRNDFNLEKQNAILIKTSNLKQKYYLLAKRRIGDNILYLRNWEFFTVGETGTTIYYMYNGCKSLDDRNSIFDLLEMELVNSKKNFEKIDKIYEMPFDEWKEYLNN
jgi:hypothetical protein